jgi:glycosyltransferase involved in cell wall biosynthesis
MKICILAASHPPWDERIFGREAMTLRNNGFEDISLIAPYEKEYEEIKGVKVFGFEKKISNSIIKKIKLLRVLAKTKVLKILYRKALLQGADIYHCHEPHSLVVGLWLKRKLGAKVIYDSHEYHPEQFAGRYKGLKRVIAYKLVYFLEKHYAKKADYVFTVCDELVEKFKSWGCKTVLIPNYARNYESLYSGEDLLIKELKDEGFVVGIFAGGMYRERGLFELIEAARILKDKGVKAAMIFVGWGDPGSIEQFEKCIKQNNLDDRLKILGYQEHRNILNMMTQSDFGIINDYPEKRNLNTIGVKFYEYMMCSLPIYCSDLPLSRKIIRDENCGVIGDPYKSESIAESLEELCSNSDFRKKLGRNARKAFEDKYNWGVVEKQLIDCYRSMKGESNV